MDLKLIVSLAGGRRPLAEHLGITTQAISQWEKVPPTRVEDVAALIGVPPHRIRPDVFRQPRLKEGEAA